MEDLDRAVRGAEPAHRQQRCSSSRPQVGGEHGLVLLHLAGGPLARIWPRSSTWMWRTRPSRAGCRARRARRPRRRRPAPQHRAEGGRLLLVLAARRLVEQQHLRPVASARASSTTGPGRWGAGRRAGGRGRRCRAARGARRRPRRGPVAPRHVGGEPDVLPDGEQPEQLEALERAGQATPGPLERRQLVTSMPSIADAAARRLEPADDVEQRGLAGAVRADEAGDRPASAVRSTSSRASRPPKRTLTSATSSALIRPAPPPRDLPRARGRRRARGPRRRVSGVEPDPLEGRDAPRGECGARTTSSAICGQTTNAVSRREQEPPTGDDTDDGEEPGQHERRDQPGRAPAAPR